MEKVQKFMDEVHQWADATFGSERKVTAVLHHLKQEVPELIEAIEQNKTENEIQLEFADVFILVLNAASKHGLTANDLMLNAELKMAINRNRKWGKADENGVVNHDRSLD